jgi:hypothetical protein
MDGRDFLDGEPKPLLPGLDYLGDFRGSAVYTFAIGTRRFLVDAPGGPGLLPFVRGRLERLGRKPAEPQVVLLTSCDAPRTAGLEELIRGCHPQVVAARAGIGDLERSCPAGTVLRAADEWSDGPGPELTPIPLRGRGSAPMAYRLRWAGKTVLFSGRIPIRYKPQTDADLFADLSASRDVTLDYLVSVYRLGEPKPDLWLPAVPVDGQNANLYDRDWPDILADNYRIGYRSLKLRR